MVKLKPRKKLEVWFERSDAKRSRYVLRAGENCATQTLPDRALPKMFIL